MSRNGNGTYTPPAGQPVVTNTTISSATFNALVSDVGNEITNSIARDGQSPATANIPFGGFKATGLGAATVAGDAVRYEQVGDLGIAQVHAATSKATPVDDDELPLSDSAASFGLKKLTWANLKTTLAAYFYGATNSWTGTNTFSGNTTLGDATTDTTTLISQLSASGGVGTSGQFLTSGGSNATPSWTTSSITASAITGQTEDTSPDTNADYILTYDASAASLKKVLLGRSAAPTLATSQNTTSGTSIDFTSIPSWVKRITVMLNGVSTNGTSALLVRIGAGSVTTSGYISYGSYAGASNSTGGYTSTAGFIIGTASADNLCYGHMTLTNVSGNTWIQSHTLGDIVGGNSFVFSGGGNLSLGGTLDRIRLTTVNGTDTFDAGSVNISYE